MTIEKEESRRLIEVLAETIHNFNQSDRCVCHEVEDERHLHALQELAIRIWSEETPQIAAHTLLYVYLTGKKVAEEQMLNLLTGVTKQ